MNRMTNQKQNQNRINKTLIDRMIIESKLMAKGIIRPLRLENAKKFKQPPKINTKRDKKKTIKPINPARTRMNEI